jgi:hypothetical protein
MSGTCLVVVGAVIILSCRSSRLFNMGGNRLAARKLLLKRKILI